jgi:carbon storage regulator
MLILARRAQQEIRIADDIVIRVVRIHRDSVKLAIVAPRDVPIIREELLERAASAPQNGANEP